MVVAAVALVPAGAVLAGTGVSGRAVAVVIAGLLVALVRGGPPPQQRVVLGAVAVTVAVVAGVPWPAPLFLAPPTVWVAAGRQMSLRPALDWLRCGRLAPGDLLAAVGIAGTSALALVAWFRWASPDVGPYLGAVRGLPIVLAALALGAFAMVNALGEEMMFRGLLQSELTPLLGPVGALACQACGFGLLHWHGIPSGWTGVAMATVYGAALGLLRLRTHGLVAAWTAHVVADMTIGVLAVTLATP